MNESESYLHGLIAGRGRILDQKIIIEFAHPTNPKRCTPICQICGNMATNSPLICKGKGKHIVPESEINYVYPKEAINYALTEGEINKEIIKINEEKVEQRINLEISGNDKITLLILDFKDASNLFKSIHSHFKNKTYYDEFEVPEIYFKQSTPRSNKIEFLNGVLDTAGKFDAGNWAPRPGKTRYGRQRGYIQFVRNWNLPVQICGLLKDLDFPIQTIRWGHPQITDGESAGRYKNGGDNLGFGFKEHQLKFWPEYYGEFRLRLPHQKKMFEDFVNYNYDQFPAIEDCNQINGKINNSKVKASTEQINDLRIPKSIRGQEIDRYWQICHKMGCKQTEKCYNNSSNPELLILAGDDIGDIKPEQERISREREKKTNIIEERRKLQLQNKEIENQLKNRKKRQYPEIKLYQPISEWLKKTEGLLDDEVTYDTSTMSIDAYLKIQKITQYFPLLTDFTQKPDIVGLRKKDSLVIFIEVKAGSLSITNLGQLLGYCLMADPDKAFLISPGGPALDLINILSSNIELLDYGINKKIQVGKWDEKEKQVEWIF